jgi:non-specific serine/threonine protein kinase
VSDPERVAEAMAAALGGEAAAARTKRALLVLDNCEHRVGAVARAVERLLHWAPGLRVLATSQEPLGVEGECLFRVAPLAVPAAVAPAPDEAMRYAAVRLFIARARAADPHFALDQRTAAAIAEICRRLDGLPLAIELAVARATALGVVEFAQRLDDRFRLLAGGRRTALPRHQTLRANLDWSCGLLSDGERRALGRLAVFGGSFTLDAALAIAAAGAPVDENVLEPVLGLVRKSLIALDIADSGPRYRLFETTRLYMLEKLGDRGARPRLRRAIPTVASAARMQPAA